MEPTPFIALQSPHEVIACPAEPLATLLLEDYDVELGEHAATARPQGRRSWDRLHEGLAREDCRDEHNSDPPMPREALDALPTAVVDEKDMSITLPRELLPVLRRRVRERVMVPTTPDRVLLRDEAGMCVLDGESVARALVQRRWKIRRVSNYPTLRCASAEAPARVPPAQALQDIRYAAKPLATSYPSVYLILNEGEVTAFRNAGREMAPLPESPAWRIPDDVARRALALERKYGPTLNRAHDAAYDLGI